MITVKVETAALTTNKINDTMDGKKWKYFMGALSQCVWVYVHAQSAVS